MLWWISVAVSIASTLGFVGLAVLFFVAPAAFAIVMRVLERLLGWVLSSRLGCALLAIVVCAPLAYGIGTLDEDHRRDAEAQRAHAILLAKQLNAAHLAALNDQTRAAAAEAARAKAETRAHELETRIPDKACFEPADTDRVRKLWQRPGRDKARAARRPRGIEDLPREDRAAAGARPAH